MAVGMLHKLSLRLLGISVVDSFERTSGYAQRKERHACAQGSCCLSVPSAACDEICATIFARAWKQHRDERTAQRRDVDSRTRRGADTRKRSAKETALNQQRLLHNVATSASKVRPPSLPSHPLPI